MMAGGWAKVESLPDADRIRRHAEQQVGELARQCHHSFPDLDVTASVLDGQPATVLTDAANDADAALLVVGSSGLGALPRALLGSTAAELVRTVERPVVVYRGDQTDQSVPSPGERPVMVGVDGTPVTEPAIDFAFEYAAWHECALHAVYAWSDRTLDMLESVGLWVRDSDQLDLVANKIIDLATQEVRDRYPDVPVRLECVGEPPAAALLERAENARLLVVGSHGHGAIRRSLLGSVSHAALYHAPCPVAVVPGPTKDGH